MNIQNNSAPPSIRFTLDDKPTVVYTAPNLQFEGDSLLFFQSDVLPPTAHQIIANTTVASAAAPFFVDYLIVEPSGASVVPPAPTTSPLPPPSSQSAGNGNTATGQNTGSPTGSSSGGNPASPTSSGDNGMDSKSSSHTGPIVGGVIAAVVVILMLLVGVFYYRRRRRDASFRYPEDARPTPAMRDTTPIISGRLPFSTSLFIMRSDIASVCSQDRVIKLTARSLLSLFHARTMRQSRKP